jgi:hypothetical protein
MVEVKMPPKYPLGQERVKSVKHDIIILTTSIILAMLELQKV